MTGSSVNTTGTMDVRVFFLKPILIKSLNPIIPLWILKLSNAAEANTIAHSLVAEGKVMDEKHPMKN